MTKPLSQTQVAGWGRTRPVATDLVVHGRRTGSGLWANVGRRGLIARGLGRSYGDAAQNAGGLTLDMTGADRDSGVDAAPRFIGPGLVTVGAGVSLDALMRWSVPQGFFVPVTPGTRFVTVGGAVAADVHGKNHHRDGSFGAAVTRLAIETPADGLVETGPGRDQFDATVGGMGLTGIIIEADLKLVPIESGAMWVTTRQLPDLDGVLAALREADRTDRYTVAWLDPLARGRGLGRGLVMAGDHATVDQLEGRWTRDPLAFDPAVRLGTPEGLPNGLLNRATVRAFNALWYHKSSGARASSGAREGLESITAFFHPLDGVRHWNRLYGARGFVQYQFVVPDEASGMLRTVIESMAEARIPSPLTVLKRFGPQNPGLLSFPMAGWTLAFDLPAQARYAPLLDRFDAMVVEAGGRIYLAKDGRMGRHHLDDMYPRLARWREVRDKQDPQGLLTSDLDRRLNLSGRWP